MKKVRSFAALSLAAVLAISFVMPFTNVRADVPGATSTPHAIPDPPLNSAAYYAASGNIQYVAAGAAMRNQGDGSITLTWTGSLVKAYLIWGVINTVSTGLGVGTINGHSITGALQGNDTSPCWGNGDIFSYAADVTSYVVNGANSLTGFASGLTTGEDPWDGNVVAPLAEGATLIVVSTGTTAQQVYIYTGTYTSIGTPISTTFNHGAADATTAKTTFVVADGQLAGNLAGWNGPTIDTNAFPGSDPKLTATAWSYGNLWDTKTYSVPVTFGATSETATVTGTDDCVTWAAQVISIPTTVTISSSTSTTTTTTTTSTTTITTTSTTSTTDTTTTSPRGVPEFSAPTGMIAVVALLLAALIAVRKSKPLLQKGMP